MITAGKVYKTAKTKVYPDGSTNTIVCRSAIFKDTNILSDSRLNTLNMIEKIERERGEKLHEFLRTHDLNIFELLDLLKDSDEYFNNFLHCIGVSCSEWFEMTKPYQCKEHEPRITQESRSDSLKRAKDSIFDYVLCNDFQYFFTGTINPELLQSDNPQVLITPVQTWLKDIVRRYGVGYVMVAERHKKGGIHFHGLLMSETPLPLVDSGTALYKGHKKPVSAARAKRLHLSDGRTVYNLKNWRFGFSTAIELTGDKLYTAFYITKYITKDCSKIFGRFFWHSRNLQKPKIIIHDLDFEKVESADYGGFKYIFERGNKNE